MYSTEGRKEASKQQRGYVKCVVQLQVSKKETNAGYRFVMASLILSWETARKEAAAVVVVVVVVVASWVSTCANQQ